MILEEEHSILIALLLLVLLFFLFISNKIAPYLVALTGLFLFTLTGFVSMEEAMKGFGNETLLIILLMFVISHAFLQTGALQYLTTLFYEQFKTKFYRSFWIFMIIVAGMSAFMNNTPIVAMFIPVIYQLSNMSGIPATKMLIPLSYTTVMGGMLTLLGTSTNLIVNSILTEHHLPAFGLFDFTLPALLMLMAGMLFIIYIGIKVLPGQTQINASINDYNLDQYIAEIEICEGSYLSGKKIMESDLVKSFDMEIIQITRGNMQINIPSGDFVLQEKDILKVKCNVEKINHLKGQLKIIKGNSIKVGDDALKGISGSLVELIIMADSEFENKTLKEIDFRHRFRAIPIAIRQRKEVLNEGIYHIPLKAGDIILAEMKTHFLSQLLKREHTEILPFIIKSHTPFVDFKPRKFWALAISFLLCLSLATMHILPLSLILIGEVLFIYLLRIMDEKEIIKSIHWQLFLMIGALFSWGKAMENAGIANHITRYILHSSILQENPHLLLAFISLITMILTEFITNNAVAIIMTPIVIHIAQGLGINPQPLALSVLFAASCSFLTPIGYQTNTMVYMAGNYKFTDFLKTGWILSLIYLLLSVFLIPLFFPF